MAKLNQIVAVVNSKKNQQKDDLTKLYHMAQKDELFQGISRVYSPNNEDGEKQPSEKKNVQIVAKDVLEGIRKISSDFLDVAATQDWSNCLAKADVVVDEKVVIKDCPVTYLMFLEKQIQDFKTAVSKVPVLDPAEKWEYSNESNSYVSEPRKANKTKKEPKTHVKYKHTPEHEAQTEMYYEDVAVGEWEIIKFSGAWSAKEKHDILNKFNSLLDAIKFAREEANSMVVKETKVSDDVFNYLFN